tara:strand:- start:212 stop:391 length:180 start_codon:yes stop_codon:yes gene_type:complete
VSLKLTITIVLFKSNIHEKINAISSDFGYKFKSKSFAFLVEASTSSDVTIWCPVTLTDK